MFDNRWIDVGQGNHLGGCTGCETVLGAACWGAEPEGRVGTGWGTAAGAAVGVKLDGRGADRSDVMVLSIRGWMLADPSCFSLMLWLALCSGSWKSLD